MKALYILIIYVAYLVIMSFVGFILYLKDKKIAIKGGNNMRIKEKTLLGVAVFGGALGSQIGRVVARHKTGKLYFSLTIYLSILLQYAALLVIIALALA